MQNVGDTWVMRLGVTDPVTGELTDADVAVLVTLPNASTAAATVTRTSTGRYTAVYVLTVAGRHTAVGSVSGAVTAVETFAVVAVAPAAGLPDLAAVKDYLGATSATDAEITSALVAETVAQANKCRVPASYPADLAEALKRRVARNLALRGLPIAVLQGDSEGGSTILPGRDPEVRRLEAPYPKLVVG